MHGVRANLTVGLAAPSEAGLSAAGVSNVDYANGQPFSSIMGAARRHEYLMADG